MCKNDQYLITTKHNLTAPLLLCTVGQPVISQIATTLGSTWIGHWSDTFALDWCPSQHKGLFHVTRTLRFPFCLSIQMQHFVATIITIHMSENQYFNHISFAGFEYLWNRSLIWICIIGLMHTSVLPTEDTAMLYKAIHLKGTAKLWLLYVSLMNGQDFSGRMPPAQVKVRGVYYTVQRNAIFHVKDKSSLPLQPLSDVCAWEITYYQSAYSGTQITISVGQWKKRQTSNHSSLVLCDLRTLWGIKISWISGVCRVYKGHGLGGPPGKYDLSFCI